MNSSHNNNPPSTSSTATPTENLVTMEMNSSPPATDLVRDNSSSSNNQNEERLCCSEIHGEEDETAKEDECDHLVFKTEEETEGQGERDNWRGLFEEEDESRQEVKDDEEGTEDPDRRTVEGENGDEELEFENLGKVEDENKEKVYECVTGMLIEKTQNSPSDLFLMDQSPQHILFELPTVTSDPPDDALQESWRWEDSGNREDFTNNHLSDCLHAKLAIVYPESDAEEDQWAASSSCEITSHIEENETISGTCDAKIQEEGMVSAEVETKLEKQGEGEVKKEGREDDEEQMMSGRDFTPQSSSVSSMTSSTDLDRREIISENVSTEHLDFLLARQQWKKMEEGIKGQPIPKPGLRTQGSFQGTHSALYPPTRSPRLKHRLQTGQSPPRPPACRTPTLSISPSPSCSSSLPQSMYHELTANNVIILEPTSSSSSKNLLFPSGTGALSEWPTSLDVASSANVIVVETSNLIIRSASEFCLSSVPASVEMQESTFTSNPFFKLRSISSQSLVEQEIRMVRQREEEWRRQREEMWRKQKREEKWRRGREKYDTVLVSPALNDNISFSVPEVPHRCVSSPSSPSRPRKIERSSSSCDHKFPPPPLSSVPQRKNTMAQRWEATLLANQKE
ncbi:uncharacterized protein LOC119414963 [Nematolebias whitei]|uniref:uncharacterized protein LOC119414963 n=1 Tax=Nematolebias whitei TaxID=451745 RepID=UPI00189B6D93|nr:uncharacterized protein LOC119414963 [Nematolebias whitei]